MTQRLPGISDADATGVAKDTLAGSNKLLGRSSNLLRILSAHTPYLARWFIGFVAAVRQPDVGAVSDVRLRNLATVKTSMTNECKYCATHTSIYGQALGISEAQLEVTTAARATPSKASPSPTLRASPAALPPPARRSAAAKARWRRSDAPISGLLRCMSPVLARTRGANARR
jgi:alkylhydroperoxidase family enzyme